MSLHKDLNVSTNHCDPGPPISKLPMHVYRYLVAFLRQGNGSKRGPSVCTRYHTDRKIRETCMHNRSEHRITIKSSRGRRWQGHCRPLTSQTAWIIQLNYWFSEFIIGLIKDNVACMS